MPILDFGEADGGVYLAMRHIEGADLRELLGRDGPLDPEEALRLVAQVGEALDEAHARGLVHRDVKPANILVDRDGAAYLGDFGLAKHASSPSSLTGEQSFVGTIAYVAPEQIKGEQVDGRADVYAPDVRPLRGPHGTGTLRTRERAGRPLRAPARAGAAGRATCGPICPPAWITCCGPGRPRSRRSATRAAPSWWQRRAARSPGSAGRGRPCGRAPWRSQASLLAAAAAGVIVAIGGGDEPAAPVHRLAVGGRRALRW